MKSKNVFKLLICTVSLIIQSDFLFAQCTGKSGQWVDGTTKVSWGVKNHEDPNRVGIRFSVNSAYGKESKMVLVRNIKSATEDKYEEFQEFYSHSDPKGEDNYHISAMANLIDAKFYVKDLLWFYTFRKELRFNSSELKGCKYTFVFEYN
jgi:hypothetical protein